MDIDLRRVIVGVMAIQFKSVSMVVVHDDEQRYRDDSQIIRGNGYFLSL
jgi:hypothetical protein